MAAAFSIGLGLGMLSYAAHAAPPSGGNTVQGLYDALLDTMKNGGPSGKAVVSRSWRRSSTAVSTSP